MKNDKEGIKIDRFFAIDVQLIVENAGEAFASVELNPSLAWIKFILTDDKPNANKNRIPIEEFPNLISSGLYMPIKMTAEEINGHQNAIPIGVITHLKEKGNKIVGLAALWEAELPEEIGYLRQRYAENKSLDLSWEIMHDENLSVMEDDVEVLYGTVLRAATFVQVPAYQGRTYVTELSETKEEQTLETKILEELKEKYTKDLETKETAIKTLEAEVQSLKDNQFTDELKSELESLRKFKAEIDAEIERQEKLDMIKETFSEFNLELAEDYFEKNGKQLLSMDEPALKFFVESLAEAQKKEDKTEGSDKKKEASTNVPNLKDDLDGKELTLAELAQAVRASKK